MRSQLTGSLAPCEDCRADTKFIVTRCEEGGVKVHIMCPCGPDSALGDEGKWFENIDHAARALRGGEFGPWIASAHEETEAEHE